MKKLIFFVIFSATIYGQYTNNDYNLVETTFNRIFNKDIVEKYLASPNSDSVKAALLSISHSNDRHWIERIVKLDFSEYGDYISFALGQLGESKVSSEYLLSHINGSGPNKYLKECYEAFGNTADSSSITSLLNIIEAKKENHTGLPYAINNFNSRFPIPHKEKFLKYLISEIEHAEQLTRKFDALFVLYRLGGSDDAVKAISEILNSADNNLNPLKYYALGSLRRISFFPHDENLFDKLIADIDPRIRIEAARTLCFYEFHTFGQVEKYLTLLNDTNPNVSRQAAISLGNIKLDDELQNELFTRILNFITDSSITENTRGELFVNYCNYKKDQYLELINKFDSDIEDEFIFRILSNNISSPQQNFNYIKGNITDTTEADFLNIVQAVIPLQDSLSGNLEFNKFILSILNSSSSIGIALIADNIDSVIVSQNTNALQQIVLEQIFRFVNNKDYTESLRSLYNLAKQISDDFAAEVLNIYTTSQINWVKSFAKNKLGENISLDTSKDIDLEKLWKFSFEFKKAKVNTEKGSYVIQFSPEAAPVSVGNFCYLASQNYFNGCVFHRVVPNFVIQTGDPSGTGWSGPGYEIVSEFSLQPFDEAYVGMASSGKDTEGSQWFVMHSNFPHLDWRYTNFGKVVEGMDVVNTVDQNDKIINIELIK